MQNQDSAGFIAASPNTVRPEEGQSAAKARLEGVGSRGDAENAEEWVEAGMAEMSKVYDETGRELYMGAGDREHD